MQSAPDAPITQPCPKCGATLPVYPGYITWCELCYWRLDPPARPARTTLFARIYANMSTRAAETMLADLQASPENHPRLTLSLALGYALAACVHLLTLLAASVTLYLIYLGIRGFVFAWVGLPVMLYLMWVSTPRTPRQPSTVSREACPTLYAVLDRVADALPAPRIDALALNESLNAGYLETGWRTRRTLILGLPLWAGLPPAERVFLLAHELAHGANGDPQRTRFIGTALYTLSEWYDLLTSASMSRASSANVTLVLYPITFTLSLFVYGFAFVLAHLFWQASQRAEYRADTLAASIAGTDPAISALETGYMHAAFEVALHRVTLAPTTDADLFATFRARLAETPAREYVRHHMLDQLYHTRLDTTHPPTTYRIALLSAHPVLTPTVTLSADEAARIEAELAPLYARIQTALVTLYRRRLSGE